MEKLRRALEVHRNAFVRIYEETVKLLHLPELDLITIQGNTRILDLKMEKITELDSQVLDFLLNSETSEAEIDVEVANADEIVSKYNKLKLRVEQHQHRVDRIEDSSQSSSCHSVKKFKLPHIEFKKFGGDLIDWLPFWSQFKRIDEDDCIANEDKFQYLIQATIPKSRARQLVESNCTTLNKNKTSYLQKIDKIDADGKEMRVLFEPEFPVGETDSTGKAALKENVRKSFYYEDLLSAVCDCESVVHSRPLTYISENSADMIPLTPAMFLHEIIEVGVPDIDAVEAKDLRRRIKHRHKLREDLKKRSEGGKTRNIKVGEVVLIGSDNTKRLDWPLAKVEEIFPGKDGGVRLVKFKTSSGHLLRPVQRLYPLEIDSIEDDCFVKAKLISECEKSRVSIESHSTLDDCLLIRDEDAENTKRSGVVTRYGRVVEITFSLELQLSSPLGNRSSRWKNVENPLPAFILFLFYFISQHKCVVMDIFIDSNCYTFDKYI
ncbi:hypothetical protein NQ317_001039 [Molorchus minor]|uniref:DUF5641 domain-containing protein n=1 Tax=Molorchus minor TaxID=1323400 RepID=A0ABQ9IZ02_9CUCU|nr:hypothetical protein NQ317_001039 [Molorchus minor]